MNKVDVALHVIAWVSLYFVIFHFIPSVMLEAGRQKLFELRDQLFDFYSQNPQKLDRQVYQGIRDYLNHTIKAMEYITWPRVVVGNLLFSHQVNAEKEMTHLSEPIKDEQVKKYIEDILKTSLKHTVTTAVLRSPLLLLLISVLFVPLALIIYVSPLPVKKIRHLIEKKITDEVYESMVLADA